MNVSNLATRGYANSILTMDQIQQRAPSVFATEPFHKMSDKYRFIPTSEVVAGLMDAGFQPTMAGQGKSRIPGKQEFTRHVVRFRHEGFNDVARVVGDSLPEIVLMNSHDGTSAYKLMLGMFRLVCSNGLIVCSAMLDEMKARHSGRDNLVADVIEGSYRVIDNAPKVANQIDAWQNLRLTREEQTIFAESANELRDSTIELVPAQLLRAHRREDMAESDGSRNMWTTFNAVQENLIKGGIRGQRVPGQRRNTTRAVQSIVEDTRQNKALWMLTERMSQIKGVSIAA